MDQGLKRSLRRSMLPCTKRPGRGAEDVITKDDLVSASIPSSTSRARGPAPSENEDELTSVMSARAVERAAMSAPVPAAGRPPTMPPPANGQRPNIRPAQKRGQHDDDDDDGRTVVRSAPVSSVDD